MKMRICFIIFILVFNFNFVSAEVNSSDQYIYDASNKDVQVRTTALIKINQGLEQGTIKLNTKITNLAHDLIKSEIDGTHQYKPEEDGENLYKWQLEELAIKINDRDVLPYLVKFIDYKYSQEAIAKQGEIGLEALIQVTENFQKLRGGEKKAVLETFRVMIGKNISANSRRKITEQILKILKENDYPVQALSKSSSISIHNTIIYSNSGNCLIYLQ